MSIRCFTQMRWIFISIPKSVPTGSYVGTSKASSLFISLLKHLKATYRRAKTITLIVDNNIIHKSEKTRNWLKANLKFNVIYQPVYSPWVNHVERLWQALHDTITHNHQCRSMWQLQKKYAILWTPPAHSREVSLVWQKWSGIRRSYLAGQVLTTEHISGAMHQPHPMPFRKNRYRLLPRICGFHRIPLESRTANSAPYKQDCSRVLPDPF